MLFTYYFYARKLSVNKAKNINALNQRFSVISGSEGMRIQEKALAQTVLQYWKLILHIGRSF
jgi:hypothetical protein